MSIAMYRRSGNFRVLFFSRDVCFRVYVMFRPPTDAAYVCMYVYSMYVCMSIVRVCNGEHFPIVRYVCL